ncbi:vitellogenic carboxypeptidase-like [Ostrinia furnacalis]|uniref:vitellogenic carboxypeptidase-like n=1 Tax=Ostrinia furnacalis TaxID=93504 RepID=UPI00103DD9BB|nr:vitellogenic carboxypeptidase-like [Ostrinia furnacalis]
MLLVCTLLLFVSGSAFCRGVAPLASTEEDGPLILTPLIEKGEIDKARSLSNVDPTLFTGIKSHSGFITVNKTAASHLFFWYFPVEEKKLEETPLVIWLQGGPGASSLFGLFKEIGPLQYENGKVSVVKTNQVGAGLLSFVQQFLMVFDELREAPLFITGESYAGKYIPAFGHYIHHNNVNNRDKSQHINLKGLAIGDGWTDPPTLLQYSEFGLQIGYLDPNQAAQVKAFEDSAKKAYKDGDLKTYKKEASAALDHFFKIATILNPYNYIDDEVPGIEYNKFLNTEEVKKALHVGRTNFTNINFDVYFAMSDDFYLSVKPWLEELLENKYPVLGYSGQLDVIVAYPLSVNTYQSLKWSGADGYKKARRGLYDDTSGTPSVYLKKYANFMDVMVRGAGHMVPYDQPQAAIDVLTYFIDFALSGETTGNVLKEYQPIRRPTSISLFNVQQTLDVDDWSNTNN